MNKKRDEPSDRTGGLYVLFYSVLIFGLIGALILTAAPPVASQTPPTPRSSPTPATGITVVVPQSPTPTNTAPPFDLFTRTFTPAPTNTPGEGTPTEEATEEEGEETDTPEPTGTPDLVPVTPIYDVTDTPAPVAPVPVVVQPAATETPTETPTETSTPTPTSTSTPTPTPTSSPTLTPTSTPTPTPTTLPDTEPPAPPRNVRAVPGGEVRISWDPNTEADLEGYRVYRRLCTPGGKYTMIAGLDKSSTSYKDDDVRSGEFYCYAVTAFDRADNESEFSDEVKAPEPLHGEYGRILLPTGCTSPLFWAVILLVLLIVTRLINARARRPTKTLD